MRKTGILLLTLVSVVLPSIAAEPAKPSDKTWAEKVAVDGMTEVQLGHIAKEKGQSSKVKDFADHMIKDHGKANDELKALASKNGITLPAKVDAEHQATIDKLKNMSGKEFDKQYLTEMIAAHKKAIAAFEDEAKGGEQEFKSWAEKTLPTLKHHLQMAEEDKSKTTGKSNG
jgi:putative membrane protein